MQLTGKSVLEVMRMPPSEFALNLIVAQVGVGAEQRAYFDTLASLLSQLVKAIFGGTGKK